jgi:D-aspartate ligase
LGRKNLVVRTREELDSFYQNFSSDLWAMIAQELIPGGDDTIWECMCTFSRSQEMIDAFTFKKLRVSPPHFGVTSYAVSQRNQEVIRLSSKLGRALQYIGPADIEVKFDMRDGQYKYLEINPRLGMCNFFSTVCGVNNVLYAYHLETGGTPESDRFQQREGLMCISLYEDLYSRHQDGESLLSALRHYISNITRPHVGAYFAWEDLRPAFMMGAFHFSEVSRSLARKATHHLFAGT